YDPIGDRLPHDLTSKRSHGGNVFRRSSALRYTACKLADPAIRPSRCLKAEITAELPQFARISLARCPVYRFIAFRSAVGVGYDSSIELVSTVHPVVSSRYPTSV